MATSSIIFLIAIFFVTSAIGVVTGSNSLITVPAMFQLGIDPKVAVATNMFGLVFMSAGSSIPFLRAGRIDIRRTTPLIVITVVASAFGALLVGVIAGETLKMIVSIAMITVALFMIVRSPKNEAKGSLALPVVMVLTFVLGIYGGLFSGGYTTMLTAVLVGVGGMQYVEAVASTKLINLFSSSIATAIFMWQGLVDYRLGLILGVTMFAGGYAGAHLSTRLNEEWLRRIFLTAVILLALKTIYDLF